MTVKIKRQKTEKYVQKEKENFSEWKIVLGRKVTKKEIKRKEGLWQYERLKNSYNKMTNKSERTIKEKKERGNNEKDRKEETK